MRIFVDADACPVVRQTEEIAKKYGVPVTLLCDTNHILKSTCLATMSYIPLGQYTTTCL